MNYAQIRTLDVANGPGLRVTIFLTGCDFHCKDCFNQEYADKNYGKKITNKVIKDIIEKLKNPKIMGLSILGGEPFQPRNVSKSIELLEFLRKIKNAVPDKHIWLWTGNIFEEVFHPKITLKDLKYAFSMSFYSDCLDYIDVLVDGRFMTEKKNMNLRFRGSSNQRVIDVQKTLRNKDNQVILYDIDNLWTE